MFSFVRCEQLRPGELALTQSEIARSNWNLARNVGNVNQVDEFDDLMSGPKGA